MAVLIVKRDSGLPQYFTAAVGKDYANAGGAWIEDHNRALQFNRPSDAKSFMNTFLKYDAPYCAVEQVPMPAHQTP